MVRARRLLIELITLLTKEECKHQSEVTFVEKFTACCKKKINHAIPPFISVRLTPATQQKITPAQNQKAHYNLISSYFRDIAS